MHKVERVDKPNSLVKNAEKWTKGLVEQIDLCGSFKNVELKYKNKYDKADVREALDKMYKGCCCFCEGQIGIQSTCRIEHLKPMSKFPNSCYEWNNLNYSCEICNGKSFKSDKWDYQNPILDPSIDNMEEFLKLDLDTGEYIAVDNNLRAVTTINHVGLNREKLVEERFKILNRLKKSIKMYIKYNEINIFLEELLKENQYITLRKSFYKFVEEKVK